MPMFETWTLEMTSIQLHHVAPLSNFLLYYVMIIFMWTTPLLYCSILRKLIFDRKAICDKILDSVFQVTEKDNVYSENERKVENKN